MTTRQILRLWLVGLGTSIVPLDTAVNIAFPDITRSFGLPVEMIQWVVICYVLTYASLMLAFGRVGDIFGHGRVFRIGLLWSGIAYLLCAIAPGYGWLLFCRFLQGIGASLVVSCGPALVTGQFPEEKRSRAVAVFTVMYAVGSAAGPLLGGVLVQIWGWPAVFWFRAPIAFAALMFLRGLPARSHPGRREPVDILGAVLLALGISTLLLMFNRLQHLDQNGSSTVALLVIAAASLFAFVRWERRIAEPIVNLRLFRNVGFTAVNMASLLVYLTSFSVILFGPYFLVKFTGMSTPIAGGVLAVSFLGGIIASPLSGSMIGRVGADRVAALGAVLGGAGLVLTGSWERDSAGYIFAILAPLLLQGLGVGFFQVAYMDIVMRTLPRQHRGVAGSIAMLSRSLGIVTGATLLTLVFEAAEALSPADALRPEESFLSAFRITFWLAGAASGLAGLLVIFAANARR